MSDVESLQRAVRFWRTTAIVLGVVLAVCVLGALMQWNEAVHARRAAEVSMRVEEQAQENLEVSEEARRAAQKGEEVARDAQEQLKGELWLNSLNLAEMRLKQRVRTPAGED